MTSRLGAFWNRLTGRTATAISLSAEPPSPRELRFVVNRELEAKVEAALDDEATWAIYGDYLQTEGDARGEPLALMTRQLDNDAARYITQNYEQLFGAIARFTAYEEMKRKEPPLRLTRYRTPVGPEDPIHPQRPVPEDGAVVRDLHWDHGFVARASIVASSETRVNTAEVLTLMLRQPAFRFLRELGFGVLPMTPEQFPALIPVIEELAPKSLKRLVIADFAYPEECEMSWAELGDVSGVWRLKNLEALTICGGSAELGTVDPAHLLAFSRETGGLRQDELTALMAVAWPRLERLELWLGTENYGGDCTSGHLKPLLDGAGFPVLKHLALKNSERADELVEALIGSPVLPRLQSVDLSMGTLSNDGLDLILRSAPALRHLQRLQLRDNYLSAARAAELTAALPQAVGLADQPKMEHDDPEYRFCSVSE